MKGIIKTLTILVLYVNISIAGREVVFIGLHGEGAPAVEKTFDRLLREHLSVLPDVHPADYIQTQRFSKMIEFKNYPTVSSALVQSLSSLASDTTLFIWGIVKEYRIKPIRKALFFARLKGELTIGLNMYSLARKEYAYTGNIKVVAYKSKGMIGFSPIEKVVHISALDRAEVLEKLEYDAVQTSGRMISAVIRSEPSETSSDSSGETEVNTYRVPSISDLFTVPSVEGAGVENEQGEVEEKDTTSGESQ